MKNIITLSLLALFVFSCTPKPGDKSFVPKNRSEEIQHIINVAPKWFRQIPKSNKNTFAVGTAKSSDYQTSIRKATLIAKAELADRVDGKISDKEKFFNLETYLKEKLVVETKSERSLQNQIDNVVIQGYAVDKQLTIAQGNYFRTFILLKK